jgi:Type II secretion system (T2SS), protein E, N-terminal domain
MVDSIGYAIIPRLYILRRVPQQYHRVLPLNIMKRYQCIVVGDAQGVLTVAIANQEALTCMESIKKLTSHAVFPVLVDPTRISLLIRRIERDERFRARTGLSPFRYLHYFQLRAITLFVLGRGKYW